MLTRLDHTFISGGDTGSLMQEGARIIHRVLRINCVLRNREDPLAQHNSILLDRYCFSREGVIYFINLLDPGFNNSTVCVHCLAILCELHVPLHWRRGEISEKCCLSCRSQSLPGTQTVFDGFSEPLKTPGCKTQWLCPKWHTSIL